MPRDASSRDRKEFPPWPDFAHLAVGVWLGFSPWLLGFLDAAPAATWNALVSGGLVIVLATAAPEARGRRAQWLLAALGLWLVLSPCALDYAQVTTASAAAIVTGVSVVALAAASLVGWHAGRRRG